MEFVKCDTLPNGVTLCFGTVVLIGTAIGENKKEEKESA